MPAARKYESMKYSGAEWVGLIPQEWAVGSISDLYVLRNEKVSDKDYPPLSVTMKGIVPQLATAAKTDDGDNRKLVRVGDFAINSRSDRRGSCGVSPYDGSVSLINTILTPRGEMHPGYYNWLFHTVQFADEFYKWGHGIVDDLWTTRWQEMKRIVVPTPPYPVQERVAAYLDAVCADIDTAIAEAKASIEDYKLLKQSIITRAVTKGLDPDVDMKDSGVEWIGQVPRNWDVIKASRVIRGTANGLTRRDLEQSKGHIVLKLKNITTDGKIDYSTANRIELTERELQNYALFDGDLLFVRVNGSKNLVGKCAIFRKKEEPVAYNDHIIRVSFNKLMLPAYFDYYLKSTGGKAEVEMKIKTAAGQYTISGEGVRAITIPITKLSEQQEIVEYIELKMSEIDALLDEKRLLMADLEAYKRSLIYEVVTGKRKVV